MHTIDLLEEALQLASESGWELRHEWLGGLRGGACRLGHIRLLFIDQSLSVEEQLDQLLQGMREQLSRAPQSDPFTAHLIQCFEMADISNELRRSLALSPHTAVPTQVRHLIPTGVHYQRDALAVAPAIRAH